MVDPFATFEDSGTAGLTWNVVWKSQTEDLPRYLTEMQLKSFQEAFAWSCTGPCEKGWWRFVWGRSCRAPRQEILARRCSRDLCTKILVEIYLAEIHSRGPCTIFIMEILVGRSCRDPCQEILVRRSLQRPCWNLLQRTLHDLVQVLVRRSFRGPDEIFL